MDEALDDGSPKMKTLKEVVAETARFQDMRSSLVTTQNPSPVVRELVGGLMVNNLWEVTSLVEIDAGNVHFERKSGSWQGGEVPKELESCSAKVGSPTATALAWEPQMEIGMPMDLGLRDDWVLRTPKPMLAPWFYSSQEPFENKGESLNAILSKNIGVDYHWDELTPLKSTPPLKE